MFPNRDFYDALDIYDDPPTLYSIMNSIVNFGRENPVKIKDLPEYARSTIFDFYYPSVGDNFNKQEFENIFLTHYMFRRINYDTLNSFKLHLMVKLTDIMPKYLKMFASLNEIDFKGTKETHERVLSDSKTSSSSGTTNSTDSTTGDNRYSNTPQNDLTDIQQGRYLSEYTYTQNTGTGSTTSNVSASDTGRTEEDITITRGDEIEEYSKFLEIQTNIYTMIFKECDSLFYGLL
ncbi:hypothetical protein J6W34_05755 [bacterium]|nr:hypothetical protein [bacterium]